MGQVCATQAVGEFCAVGTAWDRPRRLAWIGIYARQACTGQIPATGLGVSTQRTDQWSTDWGNAALSKIIHEVGLCGIGLCGRGHAS
jgi:hypothetical protein